MTAPPPPRPARPSDRPSGGIVVALIAIIAVIGGLLVVPPLLADRALDAGLPEVVVPDVAVPGDVIGGVEFRGWSSQGYQDLEGTYRVEILSNDCGYQFELRSVEPSGPGGLVMRSTTVASLSEGLVLGLARGTYEVVQLSPTFICDWSIVLIPS